MHLIYLIFKSTVLRVLEKKNMLIDKCVFIYIYDHDCSFFMVPPQLPLFAHLQHISITFPQTGGALPSSVSL